MRVIQAETRFEVQRLLDSQSWDVVVREADEDDEDDPLNDFLFESLTEVFVPDASRARDISLRFGWGCENDPAFPNVTRFITEIRAAHVIGMLET